LTSSSSCLEILRVNGERLDAAYLDAWAPHLDVADDLEAAREEAGRLR
jgi:hypothetical protein